MLELLEHGFDFCDRSFGDEDWVAGDKVGDYTGGRWDAEIDETFGTRKSQESHLHGSSLDGF